MLVNGWLQGARHKTGLGQITNELEALGEQATLLGWREHPKRTAAEIKRTTQEGGDSIYIVGFSYGGYSATTLCWELSAIGVRVEELILCDAVYRLWDRLASIRSLRNIWSIHVPTNVKRVTSWRQKVSKPSGHRVVVDGRYTSLDSRSLLVRHAQVDRAPEIKEHILAIAGGSDEAKSV